MPDDFLYEDNAGHPSAAESLTEHLYREREMRRQFELDKEFSMNRQAMSGNYPDADRWRNAGGGWGENRMPYIASAPPALNPYLTTPPRFEDMRIDSQRDPSFWYAKYIQQLGIANMHNENFKQISQSDSIPQSAQAFLHQEGFNKAYMLSERFRQQSIDTGIAYERQKEIQRLRQEHPDINNLAQNVEQGVRDYRISLTKPSNSGLREAAFNRYADAMHQWNGNLESFGLNNPKGGYLLSGVPAQFLDDLSDKAVNNAKIKMDEFKLNTDRYVNDKNYRATVNNATLDSVSNATERLAKGGKIALTGLAALDALKNGPVHTAASMFAGPVLDLNGGEQEYLDKHPQPISKETQDYIDNQEKQSAQDALDEKNKAALFKSITDADTINKNVAKSDFWSNLISK